MKPSFEIWSFGQLTGGILGDLLLTYDLGVRIMRPTRDRYTFDFIFSNYHSVAQVHDVHFSMYNSSLYHFLDHTAILFQTTRRFISSRMVVKRKVFSEADIEFFIGDLSLEGWHTVFASGALDEAYNSFISVLSYYFNKNFLLKKMPRRLTKHWVNDAVRASSDELREIFCRVQVSPEMQHMYTSMRQEHRHLVAATKKAVYQRQVLSSDNVILSSWRVESNQDAERWAAHKREQTLKQTSYRRCGQKCVRPYGGGKCIQQFFRKGPACFHLENTQISLQ